MPDPVAANTGPPRPVPDDYDDYYLQLARDRLLYACPISIGLVLGFFGWDCLFLSDWTGRLETLVIRVLVCVPILAMWVSARRFRSLRAFMLTMSGTYFTTLVGLTLVLTVLPKGLFHGIAGLLLTSMVACGLFCLRPVPAFSVGAAAIPPLVAACMYGGLSVNEISSAVIFFGSGIGTSGAFMILLDRQLRQRHAMERALSAEKEQSEILLKEILPRYVIQRIREGAENIAESMSEVNVIFIDMVGFTAMSHRLAPQHLVEVLGEVFRSFDTLSEQHSVTKIKTIGDAYMAATGAPEPSKLSAVNAVEFCFAAIRSVEEIAARTGIPLQVRVGVATGAAISGVLSLKRPAYDLWGETVNLAARMESTSAPGRVHIAETTYWRVKDKYACEPCGLIDVKGVGSIQTYFIQSKS